MFSSNTSQVSGGYEIQRSLRFNQADDTYLNRTPASAGTRTTWTWSAWVKRTNLSDFQYSVFGAGTGSNYDEFRLTTADKFRFFIVSGGSVVLDLLTTQVFRDPSAWYHFVVAYDSTQATASNRAKLYVNGSQITALDTATYPAQNTNTTINNNVEHTIGRSLAAGFEYNGYQTEINFIDGQALTPSSFGAFDAQTGVWGPTRYAGSYGTNGFYLNFSDNSNTTAATLGRDYSGNSNNWTPNNFSVSAGAGNDSLVDVPTNWGVDTGVGGSVRGNYATWNLLANPSGTLANGNLQATGGTTRGFWGTIGVTTGKWYWEYDIVSASVSNGPYFGFSNYASTGQQGTVYGLLRSNNGTNASSGVTATTAGSGSITSGTVGVALDLDAGTATIYHNNTVRLNVSAIPADTYYPSFLADAVGDEFYLNAGQRPFAYTAPLGFRALNTQNLPTPTIGATTATQAGKFFNPVLYTGNGSTQNITGVGFQPDWVWLKSRSNATDNELIDVLRGATNALVSNSTAAATTDANGLTAFASDGFALGTDANYNGSGRSFVAWNWKANGAGVTNTAGSITSTVSANTTSGFSVVTYTGTGANATAGHGLGAAPAMIIVKSRTVNASWFVYFRTLGATQFLRLSGTNAADTASTLWNNTAPTSTVFSLGTDAGVNGGSGNTYVAYCFAEVPGYSRFGSYTGNGSTDGPFVFTGFRPAYVMIKNSSATGDWMLWDDVRSPANVVDELLYASLSIAEQTYTGLDFTANGFKIRNTSADFNANGNSYIFMAFAEAPQKFALAR